MAVWDVTVLDAPDDVPMIDRLTTSTPHQDIDVDEVFATVRSDNTVDVFRCVERDEGAHRIVYRWCRHIDDVAEAQRFVARHTEDAVGIVTRPEATPPEDLVREIYAALQALHTAPAPHEGHEIGPADLAYLAGILQATLDQIISVVRVKGGTRYMGALVRAYAAQATLPEVLQRQLDARLAFEQALLDDRTEVEGIVHGIVTP